MEGSNEVSDGRGKEESVEIKGESLINCLQKMEWVRPFRYYIINLYIYDVASFYEQGECVVLCVVEIASNVERVINTRHFYVVRPR